MSRGVLLLVAGLLALSGCSSREGTYAVSFREDGYVVRHVLPYPPDVLWMALVGAYEALELPSGPSQSRQRREYITPYLQAAGPIYGQKRSDFFSCGKSMSAPIADQSTIIFAIRTWIEPDRSGGSQLFLQLDARARRMDVSTGQIDCSSTGRLEEALIGEIRARARAASS